MGHFIHYVSLFERSYTIMSYRSNHPSLMSLHYTLLAGMLFSFKSDHHFPSLRAHFLILILFLKGALVVYDVTDENSFKNVPNWIETIKDVSI